MVHPSSPRDLGAERNRLPCPSGASPSSPRSRLLALCRRARAAEGLQPKTTESSAGERPSHATSSSASRSFAGNRPIASIRPSSRGSGSAASMCAAIRSSSARRRPAARSWLAISFSCHPVKPRQRRLGHLGKTPPRHHKGLRNDLIRDPLLHAPQRIGEHRPRMALVKLLQILARPALHTTYMFAKRGAVTTKSRTDRRARQDRRVLAATARR